MADPPPTWLCVVWASMHVVILGRMILAALSSGAPDYSAALARGVPPADRDLVAVGVARPAATHHTAAAAQGTAAAPDPDLIRDKEQAR